MSAEAGGGGGGLLLIIASSAAAGLAFIARLALEQFIRDERRLRRARV